MIDLDGDKAAALRIMSVANDELASVPTEDVVRQVRLLQCVREVIETAHGHAHWVMIYRAAERLRQEKALRLQGPSSEDALF
jgi:hypothetical protein